MLWTITVPFRNIRSWILINSINKHVIHTVIQEFNAIFCYFLNGFKFRVHFYNCKYKNNHTTISPRNNYPLNVTEKLKLLRNQKWKSVRYSEICFKPILSEHFSNFNMICILMNKVIVCLFRNDPFRSAKLWTSNQISSRRERWFVSECKLMKHAVN